jgi:hypothetical protein
MQMTTIDLATLKTGKTKALAALIERLPHNFYSALDDRRGKAASESASAILKALRQRGGASGKIGDVRRALRPYSAMASINMDGPEWRIRVAMPQIETEVLL